MTTIYLVRHGQASFGAQNYDQLSALGISQAQVLNQYLMHVLKEQPYTVAGTMQRHQQTAQFALEGITHTELEMVSAWNEFDHQEVFAKYDANFAQPQHLKAQMAHIENPRDYLVQIFSQAMQRWASTEFDHEYVETWSAFQARVEHALTSLSEHLSAHHASNAVIFTSGGVISVAVGKVLGLSAENIFALNWAIANCSITKLRLVDGKLELLSFNEHQYLQQENEALLSWI